MPFEEVVSKKERQHIFIAFIILVFILFISGSLHLFMQIQVTVWNPSLSPIWFFSLPLLCADIRKHSYNYIISFIYALFYVDSNLLFGANWFQPEALPFLLATEFLILFILGCLYFTFNMKDSFAGYRTHGWQFYVLFFCFLFKHFLNMLFHCLWFPLFLRRNWLLILLRFPVSDELVFSWYFCNFLLAFGFQYFYHDISMVILSLSDLECVELRGCVHLNKFKKFQPLFIWIF
jgi:hypothetical protein